ncbi:class I SAM-dependent methyltransferase [Candidatus Saccharibacteria bacterium]|nr:class I SAM-dependent methyltransferase [Candidatus Saccharibacteria bacterium]
MATQAVIDNELLIEMYQDPAWKGQRMLAKFASKLLGKIIYGLFICPQAMTWKKEPSRSVKMLGMYLVYIKPMIKAGIPADLLKIVDDEFGGIGKKHKPIRPVLFRCMQFISILWYMRFVATYHLLVEEFKQGKNVVSIGCGSGIIETLALIASGNKAARLTLLDNDTKSVGLASEIIAVFAKNGHDVSNQATARYGDIGNANIIPAGTDTVVSIGLLHNYFSLDEANRLMQGWFDKGAKEVITDICYPPKSDDEKLRIRFINFVLEWALYPAKGGLRFYSWTEFFDGLPRNMAVEQISLGPGAVAVVTEKK